MSGIKSQRFQYEFKHVFIFFPKTKYFAIHINSRVLFFYFKSAIALFVYIYSNFMRNIWNKVDT